MSHACRSCPNEVFNNDAAFPDTCDKCGGDMRHDFDEEPERDEEGGSFLDDLGPEDDAEPAPEDE